MQARKKLTAILDDPSQLRLDTKATRSILGDHHLLHSSSTQPYYLVCYPPNWRNAQTFLSDLGVQVLPWVRDSSTTVSSLTPKGNNHPKTLPASILATDQGWAAHQKLHDALKWPHFDPMDDQQ